MRFAVAALLAVLAAPTAFASIEDRCQEPFGPVVPDGNTATQAEMRAAKVQVLNFIKDSDSFQSCVVLVIDDPKEEMKEPEKKSAMKKLEANQREKEEVAAAYNNALKVFKARGLSLE